MPSKSVFCRLFSHPRKPEKSRLVTVVRARQREVGGNKHLTVKSHSVHEQKLWTMVGAKMPNETLRTRFLPGLFGLVCSALGPYCSCPPASLTLRHLPLQFCPSSGILLAAVPSASAFQTPLLLSLHPNSHSKDSSYVYTFAARNFN